MRLSPLRLVPILLTSVLCLAAARAARAGWWDDLDKGDQVKLSDLTSEAERWKGKVVTFTCVYHGPDSVYQPYFTSFNAEKHLNFTAWYDGAPIWEREAFQNDEFPYLYLPRSHPQRDELLRTQAYTRIEVTGRVRDVYRMRPWIEVMGFHETAATFGKQVVEWMKDGDAYAANGDYGRAEANYKLVDAQIRLDDVTRLRVRKRLADARRAAGKGLDPASAASGPVLGGTEMPHLGRGGAPTEGTPTQPLPEEGVPGAVPAVPVAPLGNEGATAPRGDGLTTSAEDLPGTVVDNTRPAGSSPRAPTAPTAPRAVPATPPCAPAKPASSPPAGLPPQSPAKPPAPVAGEPAPPAPAAAAGTTPAPPPPRTPRLSGVK